MRYAFRCKNCGCLETAAQAGESSHPHACRVCGKGVTHTVDPRSGAITKTFQPENWEALCECTPEQLEQIGISADQVDKHEPWAAASAIRAGKTIERTAGDTLQTRDISK